MSQMFSEDKFETIQDDLLRIELQKKFGGKYHILRKTMRQCHIHSHILRTTGALLIELELGLLDPEEADHQQELGAGGGEAAVHLPARAAARPRQVPASAHPALAAAPRGRADRGS